MNKITSYSLPDPKSWPSNKLNWQVEPNKAVLLIHDMQQYFINFYETDSPLVKTLIGNIVKLRQYARQQQIPIVYTAQPAQQSEQHRALLNDLWGPGLNLHPEMQPIVDVLAPENQDIVLTKWRYSAFQRSILRQIMAEDQRDQLIICGIYAHIGCMVTAVDAFMHDIKPFFVADAVAAFSQTDHIMSLKYVAQHCGRLIGTDEIVKSSEIKLSKDQLRQQILNLIDVAENEFNADENLLDYGLDSVQMMKLIAQWRKNGIDINFVELAKQPSMNHWWQLIEQRAAGDR